MKRRLGILGAGPKAIAIAAKWTALKQTTKMELPDLTIIEPDEVGAAWGGDHGYTNGRLPLCTVPEYDLGFPYQDWPGYPKVIPHLWREFSWARYDSELAQDYNAISGEMEKYAHWVHRGARAEAPEHGEFASYLKWAFKRRHADVKYVRGMVSSIEVDDQGHMLVGIQHRESRAETREKYDGLVVTGCGPPRRFPGQPDHADIFTGKDIWGAERWLRLSETRERVEKEFKSRSQTPPKKIEVAIIGSGETAATIAIQLAKADPAISIIIINRGAALFSRGEGFSEERLFTDLKPIAGPRPWAVMNRVARSSLIRQLDRGVISPASMQKLSQIIRLEHHSIEVESIALTTGQIPITEQFTIAGKQWGQPMSGLFPAIIVCAGFDAWWFLGLSKGRVFEPMQTAHSVICGGNRSNDASRSAFDKARTALEDQQENLDESLAMLLSPTDWPRLHLPMLSGLKHGPGLPNLTCLGDLSDRILKPYLA